MSKWTYHLICYFFQTFQTNISVIRYNQEIFFLWFFRLSQMKNRWNIKCSVCKSNKIEAISERNYKWLLQLTALWLYLETVLISSLASHHYTGDVSPAYSTIVWLNLRIILIVSPVRLLLPDFPVAALSLLPNHRLHSPPSPPPPPPPLRPQLPRLGRHLSNTFLSLHLLPWEVASQIARAVWWRRCPGRSRRFLLGPLWTSQWCSWAIIL